MNLLKKIIECPTAFWWPFLGLYGSSMWCLIIGGLTNTIWLVISGVGLLGFGILSFVLLHYEYEIRNWIGIPRGEE